MIVYLVWDFYFKEYTVKWKSHVLYVCQKIMLNTPTQYNVGETLNDWMDSSGHDIDFHLRNTKESDCVSSLRFLLQRIYNILYSLKWKSHILSNVLNQTIMLNTPTQYNMNETLNDLMDSSGHDIDF